MAKKRIYAWIPDVPDVRDFRMMVPMEKVRGTLPESYDMRKDFSKAYDQGELGSCTANAVCAAFQFTEKEQKLPAAMPSRLFVYYNTRSIQGTISEDSGASLRDSIKSLNKFGVCLESELPYDISRFKRKPSVAAYRSASAHKVTEYARVNQTLNDLRSVLAANNPIVFGFAVYDSFEGPEIAKTGKMKMPDFTTESMRGGHAVTLVGYDDRSQHFIVRNSWGTRWGDKGYFYMPYEYVLNRDLSDDFWTIKAVP